MDTRFSERFTLMTVTQPYGTFLDILDSYGKCVATIEMGYFDGGTSAPAAIEVRYNPTHFSVHTEPRLWQES